MATGAALSKYKTAIPSHPSFFQTNSTKKYLQSSISLGNMPWSVVRFVPPFKYFKRWTFESSEDYVACPSVKSVVGPERRLESRLDPRPPRRITRNWLIYLMIQFYTVLAVQVDWI